MSQFIFKFTRNGSSKVAAEEGFDRVAAYYRSCTQETVIEESWTGLDGAMRVLFILKSGEQSQIVHHPQRRLTGIMSGHPQRNGRMLTAEDLLQSFIENGPDRMPLSIDGGWCGCICDEREFTLYLYRDRIGLSPLYYADDGHVFIGSTAAGAIIRSGWVSSDTNPKVVAKYASSNYRAVFGREETFFNAVRSLPPATVLQLDRKGGKQKRRYWDFDVSVPYLEMSDEEMVRNYRERMVHLMRNYVDAWSNRQGMAVALSGGIDSGTICGLYHHVTGERIDAISMIYDEDTDYDESSLINYSVRDHIRNWYPVTLTPDMVLQDFQGIYDRFDMPIPTVSIYGYDRFYREAPRFGLKNVFNGAGGDYLQAGNYTNYYYHLADLKMKEPSRYQHELSCWIRNHSTKKYPKTPETADRFFEHYVDFRCHGQLRANPITLADNILNPDYERSAGDLSCEVVRSYGSYLRSYIVQEYWYEATPPGLDAEALTCWTWGVNMIAPFLAHEALEYAWEIPPEYKIKDGVNKVLARRAMRGLCAGEILDRVDKSGFNAPFDIWSRGPLRGMVLDTIGSSKFRGRGIYNKAILSKAIKDHMAGRSNHQMLLWQAVNLELWLQNWIDQ